MRDSRQRFSRLTVVLHWLVSITIIGLLIVGIYMETYEVRALYPIHKSIGILIFVVIIARVIWRIINGWPTPVGPYKRMEQLLAKIVHWILLTGSVALPITGIAMTVASGRALAIFGWELVARHPDPANPDKILALSKPLATYSNQLHWIIAYILIAALGLHILGALKHHVIDKDGTLRRMLGKTI